MQKPFSAMVLIATLLVAGCSPGGAHSPMPAPPASATPHAPSVTPPPTSTSTAPALQVQADPSAAAPGQAITLTLRAADPGQLNRTDVNARQWVVPACFAGCHQGRWYSLSFSPVDTRGTTFTAPYTLPLFLPDASGSPQPLATGTYTLSLSCVVGEQTGCGGRPQAEVQIQVTGSAGSLAWADLPLAKPTPLPVLGGFTDKVVDPTDSRHQIVCHTGSPNRVEMPDIPHLAITHDGGKTWERVSLVDSPFHGQHNIIGCRTVALDPHHPDTFYAEDGGNHGEPAGMTQPPYVTTDHGRTWTPVPMPDGLLGLPGPAFRGFVVSSAGVTAWFSLATFAQPVVATEQIAGQLTADGGRTWRKLPLTCGPSAAPACALQVTTGFLRGQNGLLRSSDRDATWDWARLGNSPIAALSFWRRGESGREFLALSNAVGPTTDPQFVPLLYSADAGQTWEPVQIPTPPGGWLRDPAAPIWDLPALRLLPDGSMLTRSWSWTGQAGAEPWYRLHPRGNQWVQVPAPAN